MSKLACRLLLFLYSTCIGTLCLLTMVCSIFIMRRKLTWEAIDSYKRAFPHNVSILAIGMLVFLFICSVYFLYISIKRPPKQSSTVDQSMERGDLQISLETIRNICSKVVSRQRGVKDVRTRIRVVESGLDIRVQMVVDGESPIPKLTGDIQAEVCQHVQQITGIQVVNVSVHVANIALTSPTKTRIVE